MSLPKVALEGEAFSPVVYHLRSLPSLGRGHWPIGVHRQGRVPGSVGITPSAHWGFRVQADTGWETCLSAIIPSVAANTTPFSLVNPQLVLFGVGPERDSPDSLPGL